VTRLTVGSRSEHAPPRRIELGADAWVLVASAALADAGLPAPFRVQDGPELDPALRDATERMLRDVGLLTGARGDVAADLDPALSETLRCQADPAVVVDSSVGLGDAQRAARHAIRGRLACGLVREQRPVGDDALDLGPVEVSAMLSDDVVAEVLRGFGDLSGDPAREPLQLDAAVSLAAVHALADNREDLAQAMLERPTVPHPLRELADGLRAFARVEVADRSKARVLLALRLDDGWWMLGLDGEDVLLRPVVEDDLVVELVTALTGAMTSAMRDPPPA